MSLLVFLLHNAWCAWPKVFILHIIFLLPLQVCLSKAFALLSHFFIVKLILVISISIVLCNIYFCNEDKLVVVDNSDFGIRDVAFEAKVLNEFGTFDWIANKNMKIQAIFTCIVIC